MASDFDQALTELYRAPLESFVAERTRLAGELKTAGHKPDAARLAKAGRPPISAWAVNQLWWHAREDFDELLETAAELRKGKLAASGAHRKALTKLTARAQKLLSEAGHGSPDATLRRISMTLSALAAAGGFEPEPPGTLSKDRDPPGFEAFGIASGDDADAEPEQKTERPTPKHAPKHEPKSKPTKSTALEKHEHEAAKRRAAAEAEKERQAAAAEAAKAREAAAAEQARLAQARAKKQAKRRELEAAVQGAKKELALAERQVERAQSALEKAETALSELDSDD